jgi:hypothetical protein
LKWLQDAERRRLEGKTDSLAAAVSASYAAGGVEYYSALMQRNKALRVLHSSGQEGHSLNYWFIFNLSVSKIQADDAL